MVEDKTAPKWYEKKPNHKNKYNNKFSRPNGTDTKRKFGITYNTNLYVIDQIRKYIRMSNSYVIIC